MTSEKTYALTLTREEMQALTMALAMASYGIGRDAMRRKLDGLSSAVASASIAKDMQSFSNLSARLWALNNPGTGEPR